MLTMLSSLNYYDDIIDFLCIEKNFSTERVNGSLEKLRKSNAQRTNRWRSGSRLILIIIV